MTVVVGTAGHIDHGKTALLQALTGIDADRLPEERARGMTIDVGYAHLSLADGRSVDFVDVPGHDRLVGNMLVGAGEIDAALLVVAADDGPRAQTLEHLELLDALGIGNGIVAVTKADLLDADDRRRERLPDAIRSMLAGTMLAEVPILLVSARSGEGLPALQLELEALAERLEPATDRTLDAGEPSASLAAAATHRARLAVDRVFSVKGRGAVVTGSLRGGSVAIGMTLRIVPGSESVRVREVQVHGRRVEATGPGRTALNLAGVEAGSLRRGFVLTDDPEVVATDRLLVALDGSAQVPNAPGGAPRGSPGSAWPPTGLLRLHIGTEQVDARIERSARWSLETGDGRRVASLRLACAIAAAPGDRFVLRRPSPPATVAGGRVLDAAPPDGPSRRRASGARLLAMVAGPSNGRTASARLDLHGALPVVPRSGLDGDRPPAVGPLMLAPDVLGALVEEAVGAVAAHHEADPASAGLPLADLRRSLAQELRRRATVSTSDALAAAAALVDGLVVGGRLARAGDRLRDPKRDAGPPPALAAAMGRLEALLTSPVPPSFAAAILESACPPEGVRALEASGRIVRLAPDLAFAASAYSELEAVALRMAERGPLSPAAFRDATGTSRRFALPLLEDLDRRGLLVRTPAGHVRGPRA